MHGRHKAHESRVVKLGERVGETISMPKYAIGGQYTKGHQCALHTQEDRCLHRHFDNAGHWGLLFQLLCQAPNCGLRISQFKQATAAVRGLAHCRKVLQLGPLP